MTRIEYLENRIDALETRLDELLGRPRGPISLTEYRIACETGDRETMRRFLKQEEKVGLAVTATGKRRGFKNAGAGHRSLGPRPAPTLGGNHERASVCRRSFVVLRGCRGAVVRILRHFNCHVLRCEYR